MLKMQSVAWMETRRYAAPVCEWSYPLAVPDGLDMTDLQPEAVSILPTDAMIVAKGVIMRMIATVSVAGVEGAAGPGLALIPVPEAEGAPAHAAGAVAGEPGHLLLAGPDRLPAGPVRLRDQDLGRGLGVGEEADLFPGVEAGLPPLPRADHNPDRQVHGSDSPRPSYLSKPQQCNSHPRNE